LLLTLNAWPSKPSAAKQLDRAARTPRMYAARRRRQREGCAAFCGGRFFPEKYSLAENHLWRFESPDFIIWGFFLRKWSHYFEFYG
jgi:hypothetical protein